MWEKLKEWWNKRHWFVRLMCVVLFFAVILVPIPILLTRNFCIFDNYSNQASVLGYILGVFGVIIAILIYRFQTVDLNKSIKKLEHMAFSMKKVDMNKLEEKLKELLPPLTNTSNITHLLVVSRYSAIPGFWLNIYGKIMQQISEAKINNMLFIGPGKKKLLEYANEVAKYNNKHNKNKSSIGRIDVNQILKEYESCFTTYSIKDKTRCSDELSKMAVNAIMIKNKSPNLYGSVHEVIFFGDPDKEEKGKPEPSQTPIVYHASVSLMAKLWKYELENILTKNEDKNWLKEFYDET